MPLVPESDSKPIAKLRVLHIISSLGDGGAEGVLYRLCCQSADAEHTVVSFLDEGKYGSMLEAMGHRVYCLRMTRGRVSLQSLIQLWRIIRNVRPDVVQTWMYHADLLGGVFAKLLGVPNIVWGIRQTDLKFGSSSWSTILIAYLNALLSKFIPNQIICCAENARKVHIGMGYSKNKCIVIPNGYDLNRFCFDDQKRGLVRSTLGIDESIHLIGMVARYDAQKDHLKLLESLAILKHKGREFRCVLIGQGLDSNNESMRFAIDKYELKKEVILLNHHANIPAVMSALDLHVLSSAFGEVFPNVIAEAMACTTPCVATDVGDTASIVGDTGWIVKPNDTSALAEAIDQALNEIRNHSQKWHKRKLAARERISLSYELKKMSDAFERVWRKQKLIVNS